MWMVAAYTGKLTVQVVWLGLRVGNHLALSLHSSSEPGKGPITIAIRARYEHDTLQHATRFFVRSHTTSIPALHENQW